MGLSMATRKELSKEVARRYQRGSRGEKISILREFCQGVGYNRHYAAFLLRYWGGRSTCACRAEGRKWSSLGSGGSGEEAASSA